MNTPAARMDGAGEKIPAVPREKARFFLAMVWGGG